ncbi:hypothetical protein OAL04_04205 [Nitrospinae bacterium]|nr:hypothetical protein [Nitrospinota bacterium]
MRTTWNLSGNKTKLTFLLSLVVIFLLVGKYYLKNEVQVKTKSESNTLSDVEEESTLAHINHLQKCGLEKEDIDIKSNPAEDSSPISIIVYVIKSESIDVNCELSPKLKVSQIANKTPVIFDSLYDSVEYETVQAIKEAVLKVKDRILIFTAPESDSGVIEINLISNNLINARVATNTYSANYLVSTESMKINYLSMGDNLHVVDQDKLIFKVSGRKTYFKEYCKEWIDQGDIKYPAAPENTECPQGQRKIPGGPFWYDALIDKNGKLIDIVSVDKKRISKCYPKIELLNKSYIDLELPNPTEKICIE